jgi:predicted RNA-binding protein with PUA-like domain
MNWLVKEEPSNYSFSTLQRDGRTTWSGVRNPLAQKHLRSMTKGDRVFFYHTGSEKAVVGIARVASAPVQDPGDRDGKLWAVDIEPVEALPAPVTLGAIKADTFFADFLLVRMGRLSVMPVTDAQWDRIVRMAG